jgi:hypothetical protein
LFSRSRHAPPPGLTPPSSGQAPRSRPRSTGSLLADTHMISIAPSPWRQMFIPAGALPPLQACLPG